MEEKFKVQDLLFRLEHAKKEYYENGEKKLSDAEFDSLEDELRTLDPQNRYFDRVGVTITRGNKVVHSDPMLSCSKCKNFDELLKWFKRLELTENTEFVIEPKIDGLSASCVYENGNLISVATRGDGYIGQNITFVSQYIETILKKLRYPVDLEVRGELYLPQNTSFDTRGKPLRNNCVGLINRKDNHTDLHHVVFTAYKTVNDDLKTECNSLTSLENLGFDVVNYKIVETPPEMEQYYQEYVKALRYKWRYETDGLIIKVNERRLHKILDDRWVVRHHHHYDIAFKPPAESCQTQLRHIEWQVSRQGHLVPMAVFHSVQIGGASINRASLHNFVMVSSLYFSEGDTILVERSNDVIPCVKENLSLRNKEKSVKNLIEIPKNCLVCYTLLERKGVHLLCPNFFCSERQIQKILHWVRLCKIRNIAEATIRFLYKKQLLRNITSLYRLSEHNLKMLIGEGFGPLKIQNFLQEVAKSRYMSVVKFITCLGIPQLQEISLQKLKIESLNDFWNFSDDTQVIGRNLITWREDRYNKFFIKELISFVHLETVHVDIRKKICLTGSGPVSRDELIKKSEDRGFCVVNTVSRDVVFLVCDNINSGSNKLLKAQKLGIKITSYEDFFNLEEISVNF